MVLKSGLDPSALARLEDLGVTMTQDYAWLYKGTPRSPFEHKRETMQRFAEQWIAGVRDARGSISCAIRR